MYTYIARSPLCRDVSCDVLYYESHATLPAMELERLCPLCIAAMVAIWYRICIYVADTQSRWRFSDAEALS